MQTFAPSPTLRASRRLRTLWLACLALFTILAAALPAAAQISTASLFGSVTDSTGAGIPHATLTITQTETGTTRTLTTKGDGSYRADFLPVGPYKATVTAPGFKKLDREGIVLTVTEDARLDLALQAGGESQTVEVTADVPLLNTGNSTLGATVEAREIENLPLVDRNVYTLLDLTPGVQNNNNAGTGANGGVINPLGYPEQHVKINGSTDSGVGQVSYYLDGGSNMTGVRNTGNPLPNPDAILEFAVQTNNFSAQFGRTSGGVVTVLTRSGTNQFHGSVFEFYRTRNFNATEHNQAMPTPYNQHRFGFTTGGPIIKDKLFFFGSYAGFRFVSANSLVSQVPSAAMQQGNFSENLPTTGLTGAAACAKTVTSTSQKFYVCDPVTRTAYPGNVVDPSKVFDPAIYNIIKAGLIPTPNPSQPSDSPYTRRDLSPYREQTDEQLGKLDYQLTAHQHVAASYFHQTGDFIVNPSGNQILNWVIHNYAFAQHDANLSHTWTITNNTVNQLFLNYTRLIGGRTPSPSESLATYGSAFAEQLPNGDICPPKGEAGCSRPQLGVSGWCTAGNAITGPVTGSNVYAIRDVVSTTRGGHTFYYGGEADLEKDAQQTTLNDYGVFSFTQASAGTAGRTSAAITDFFFGRPNTMGQDVPVYANANYWNFGAFFQDDWRVSPTFTLNLGVRYDIQTTPTDTLRRTLNFKPGVQSTVAPSAPVGVLLPGDPGVAQGGVPTRYNHVSPRVGLVWKPYANGNTVVHAGGGVFFGSVAGNLFTYPSNGEPFSGRPTFNKVVSVTNPYATDPSEFCGGVPNCTVGSSPFPFIYDPKNPKFVVVPASLIPMDPNFRWPEIYQLNFGVQQQFTRTLAVSMNYVASLSRKLPIEMDINYPIYTPGAPTTPPTGAAATVGANYPNTSTYANNRRPFNQSANLGGTPNAPEYSTVSQIQSSESANYNGLQVSVIQTVTHGLSIRGFYTWSKDLQSEDLDTPGNTGNSAGSTPEDVRNRYLDRQRSDFDQRHVATIAFIYNPTYTVGNRIVRQVVNGWTLTALWRMQSGNPFNITTGNDNNGDAVTNDRPNLQPGAQLAVIDNGHSRTAMMSNWVNIAQFCQFDRATTLNLAGATNAACPQVGAGPGGSDGTVRQNALDAPGRRSVDASLFREFPIYEQVHLQLRAESTNVFNLTNLPAPVSTLSSGYTSFGHITGTIQGGSFSNRILQVGARVIF